MTREFPQFAQGLEKCAGGPIPWIAPLLAVGLIRLFVSGGQKCTVVAESESLPVEIPRACETGAAGTLTAAVLVHNNAAKSFDSRGNPH
jgi:hypothetical protein